MEDKLAKVLKSTPVTPLVTATFEGHAFPLSIGYKIFKYQNSIAAVIYSPMHETKKQVLNYTWAKDYPIYDIHKEVDRKIISMFRFKYIKTLVVDY